MRFTVTKGTLCEDFVQTELMDDEGSTIEIWLRKHQALRVGTTYILTFTKSVRKRRSASTRLGRK